MNSNQTQKLVGKFEINDLSMNFKFIWNILKMQNPIINNLITLKLYIHTYIYIYIFLFLFLFFFVWGDNFVSREIARDPQGYIAIRGEQINWKTN